MKKVVFIFGTRPEAIKLVELIKIFKNNSSQFKTYVLVTAQHREMLDQVMSLFDIVPDFDLDIMAPNQSLEQISIKILKDVSKILDNIKPDLVLVQGDTTTTFVGALAAFYKKVPIGHVEAGLGLKIGIRPFQKK